MYEKCMFAHTVTTASWCHVVCWSCIFTEDVRLLVVASASAKGTTALPKQSLWNCHSPHFQQNSKNNGTGMQLHGTFVVEKEQRSTQPRTNKESANSSYRPEPFWSILQLVISATNTFSVVPHKSPTAESRERGQCSMCHDGVRISRKGHRLTRLSKCEISKEDGKRNGKRGDWSWFVGVVFINKKMANRHLDIS